MGPPPPYDVAADVRTVRRLLGASRGLAAPRRDASVRRAATELRRCGRREGREAWVRLADRLLGADGPRLEALLDSVLAELASLDDPADAPAPGEVLVVEPDPALAAVLGLALDEPDRALAFAADVAAARARLDAGAVDVVVASLDLGLDDARDLVAWMRASPRQGLTPVVLCGVDHDAVAECHALGADVVLAEPSAPDVLAAAVHHLVRRARRERALRGVDPSTGLPDAAGLRAAFERLRAACARRHRPFSLARIDLPPRDEACVRDVAARAENVLRRADVLGRIGPGALVVLMPETDAAGARRAARRLLAHVDVDGLQAHVEALAPTDTWTAVLARAARQAPE